MPKGKESKTSRNTAVKLRRIEEVRSRLLAKEEVREAIARSAYERYERRGGHHGSDLEDWLEAENEVLSPLVEKELKRAPAKPRKRAQAKSVN
jgi:aspartate oxidase